MQKIFSIIFLAMAIIELVGFLLNKGSHCLWAAIFMLVIAIVINPKKNTNEKTI